MYKNSTLSVTPQMHSQSSLIEINPLKLFVMSLPSNSSSIKGEIAEFFSQFGEVKDVNIFKKGNMKSKSPKISAFVTYSSEQGV